MIESLPEPVAFDALLTDTYQSAPSELPRMENVRQANGTLVCGGYRALTRGSLPITIRYNPEACLAPDAISDAFGRLAAFGLDGYHNAVQNLTEPARLLDLGAGTGIFTVAVLGTIKRGHNNLGVDMVDTDAMALLTADRNVQHAANNLPTQPAVRLRQNSWLESAAGLYNYIYFNPPYLQADHPINDPLAARAPKHTTRVPNMWQEYGKVLPCIGNYLSDRGMAIARLPRQPDVVMFRKLGALCANLRDPLGWSFVRVAAGPQQREGFGLLIINREASFHFGEYDYFHNYLDGKYKPYAAQANDIELYGDAFCSISRFKRPYMQQKLGGMSMANI